MPKAAAWYIGMKKSGQRGGNSEVLGGTMAKGKNSGLSHWFRDGWQLCNYIHEPHVCTYMYNVYTCSLHKMQAPFTYLEHTAAVAESE